MGDEYESLPESRFVMVLRNAPNNRKFRRLARELDISRFEAFGLTVALWDWVDGNRVLGSFGPDFDAEDLADAIGVEHIEPAALANAWVKVGLLDHDENGYHVHEWIREGRSGWASKVRKERAQMGAHKRWHVDMGIKSPDCRLCVEPAEKPGETPEVDADGMPTGIPTSMPTGMPDARRETQDAETSSSDDDLPPFLDAVVAKVEQDRRADIAAGVAKPVGSWSKWREGVARDPDRIEEARRLRDATVNPPQPPLAERADGTHRWLGGPDGKCVQQIDGDDCGQLEDAPIHDVTLRAVAS